MTKLVASFLVGLLIFVAACGSGGDGSGGGGSGGVVIPGFNLQLRGPMAPSDAFGAAAEQQGVWVVVAPNSTTMDVSNVDGNKTAVSVVAAGIGDTFHPVGVIDDGIIFRTGLRSDFPFDLSITINDLPDDQYDFFYYSSSGISGLTINGELQADLPGGSADLVGARGTNWDRVRVNVAAGTIVIVDATPPDSDQLAGLQLVPVR